MGFIILGFVESRFLKNSFKKLNKIFIIDILEQLGKFEYGLDIRWFLWNYC